MRYLDDLTSGDRFTGGPVTVTEEDIVAFARQFDPQPFHLDPEAARDSVFGGLAASGWHTAGLTMRMIVTGNGALAGGFVGMGVEDIRWPMPTRPGDVLRIESEILEVRVSAKRPDRGIARVRTTTLNQDGAVVQQMTANLLVPRRPGADPA
ncbi:MaoC family dehydratase [Azospirillum brasilense]|uniref:MaoC family dehydratase n=1 Tax=Azospirillum brasilense TaxID=192 RepID=A0A4D8QW18_AZOBR|nr:MaoC family dehydratase [Azospirillum brasilense]QCO14397.1 MaoC family dehydratase [Azospirillum brasilense]